MTNYYQPGCSVLWLVVKVRLAILSIYDFFSYYPGQVFSLAYGDQKQHWIVLVRQAGLLLLESAATNPLYVLLDTFPSVFNLNFRSKNTELFLRYLNVLLLIETGPVAEGDERLPIVQVVLDYLIRREFYNLLGKCVRLIVSRFLH